jgi:hypothetical protein
LLLAGLPMSFQREQVFDFQYIYHARQTPLAANRSLEAVAAFPRHYLKKGFFRTSTDDLFGARVSPKPKNGSSHFLAV